MKTKTKEYCTQNNGDCESCSLSSYGKDCKNSKIETGEKKMKTNEEIKKILTDEMGGNLWEKNGKSRIYFNPQQLGLITEKYNTGNISDAYLNGERISNSEASRILNSKLYYDLQSNKVIAQLDGVHTGYTTVANKLIKSIERMVA